MTDATQNQIFAHVSTRNQTGYTKAKDNQNKKTDYYYMFTGGYTYDPATKTVGPHTTSNDEGPAGEVELTTTPSAFSVTVVNDDATDFKIEEWNLAKDGDLSGEIFSPAPGQTLDPLPEILNISVTEVPTGQKDKYKGYFVNLKNSAGQVIKLDPRIYDKRP
jgi:hypothetical protein